MRKVSAPPRPLSLSEQGATVTAAQVEKNKARLLEEWEELPPVFVSSSVSGLGKEEILDYIGTVLQNL